MAPHIHYVEPYFGGGAVLMARDPMDKRLMKPGTVGVSEVVNDIHKDLTAFWRVMADEAQFPLFRRRCEATPFSEEIYREAAALLARNQQLDPVERAWAFFVACRMSLAGRMNGFTGITKTRTRSGMNNESSAWVNAVDGLSAVHQRLRRVVILAGRDALTVIRGHDGPDTFFYLDPPYLTETRTAPKVYRHEYTRTQHENLLVTLGGEKAARLIMARFRRAGDVMPPAWETVKPVSGKFILSGYPSRLYEEVAGVCGWHCERIEMANAAAGGKEKRRMVECLWSNYRTA